MKKRGGMSGFWRRVVRRFAVVVSAMLVVNAATQSVSPQLLALPSINLSAMMAWAGSEAHAVFPHGAAGHASGLGHDASAASTRAGGGTGSAPGKGAGALGAYAPKGVSVKAGMSGRAFTGFNAKTSKLDPQRSSSDISVYDNADGSITKHVSATRVNYRDAQGQWQPIDTSLQRTTSGDVQDSANSFKVAFSGGSGVRAQSAGGTLEDAGASASASPSSDVSGTGGAGELASVDLSSSESFGWSLSGAAQVVPVVSGDTATYSDILPDTTLMLENQAWGVRELFQLSSPAAGNSWTFPLSMTGVTLAQASDGTWQLVDGSGTAVAQLDTPWAMDSNFDPTTGMSAETSDVSYALATVNGVEELTMTLSSAWLDDPSRVFPVTVDPTVIVDGESAGTVLSTYADANCTSNCVSNDTSPRMAVGNNAGTGDLARSFVEFPASDLVDQGYHVESAQIAAFMFWTGNSTDLATNSSGLNSLEVGPLATAIPTGTLTWNQTNCEGNSDCTGTNIPLMVTNADDAAWTSADGWSSASACQDITNAGYSTNENRWVYTDISDVSMFNAWESDGPQHPYYGFFMAGVNDFDSDLTGGNSWKQFASASDSACAPYLSITEDPEVAPSITSMAPAMNASLATLTPTFRATGTTTDSWNPALEYDFSVNSGSTGAQLKTSGWSSSTTYTLPAGILSWGQTYTWTVEAYDGDNYGGYSSTTFNAFSTVAPPPLLTDELSQNTGGHGVDPAIGNYTTSATDATESGIGPALEIDRDYNSLDPRTTQALGAGWSSILDSRATQVLGGDGNLLEAVFTDPDGAQLPFGYNGDGSSSYAPPEGTFATVSYSSTGGYTMIDKQDTTYVFGQNLTPAGQTAQVWGLSSVTNAQGQALTLAYTSGRVTGITGASGRHLTINWQTAQPSDATALHVASIVTDPVTVGGTNTLTWTYTYTGDELTSVCDPDSHCTDYTYASGSEYQNAVLDSAPTSYWPLSEPSGSVPAASAVLANEQSDQGTYTNVTMSATGAKVSSLEIQGGDPPSGTLMPAPIGPLAGSQKNVAEFGSDGVDSSLYLPKTSVVGQAYLTIALWFKTTTAGPLWCEQDATLADTPGNAVCSLYVGTDGKLHGGFNTGANVGMTHSTTVTDGAWHYAVLEAGANGQALYLDDDIDNSGKPVTETGLATNLAMSDTYVGAGYNSTDWAATPTTKADWYFTGEISDVAYWEQALSGAEIENLHQIAGQASSMLTSITNPVQVADGSSGVPAVQVAYDTNTGRVMDVWDGQAEYQLSTPSVTGSPEVFRSAVLGSGPGWYWPLDDAGGTTATTAENQVDSGTATYNAASLGQPGFSTEPSAGFDGSSSYVQLTSGILNNLGDVSVAMWFKTSSPNGVLFSHSATPASPPSTTVTADYQPWLYVGADGKLVASIGATDGVESSKVVDDGAWHYVEFTASGSTDELYLDGKKVGTGTVHHDTVDEDDIYVGTGYIGGGWPDEQYTNSQNAQLMYFNGQISDVAVWRSALDEQTASSLYNAAQNSTGIAPVETVVMADPGATSVSIPFDGTSYSAAAGGHTWQSTNTNLVFQTDGNLVVRNAQTSAALWSSQTSGNPSATLTFQTDGNLVIYNGSTPIWSSGTAGDPNVTGILTAAGDFELDSGAAREVWHTGTDLPNATGVDTYQFDPLNGERLVAETDARGYTTTYGYDTNGFPSTITDPNGNVTTTQHDVRGNLVAQTTCQDFAANQCSTQYWTYSPDDTSSQLKTPSPLNDQVLTSYNGDATSSTDAAHETTYTYDNLGDRTSVTTPPVATESATNGVYSASSGTAGLTTTYEYTGEVINGTTITATDEVCGCLNVPNGLLISSTAPGGGQTTYGYYSDGDLASVTTPAGLVTTYTYDGLGRLSSKTVYWWQTYSGNASQVAATTSYTYNAQGQVLTETDPQTTDAISGHTHERETTNHYDADGNLLQQQVSDLGTGADATRTANWFYTPYDQVEWVTDPDGNKTQYTYYPNGLKQSQTDPENNTTDYQYDADGHLIATILENYDGSASDDSTAGPLTVESRAYDPAGRLASVTNAEGVTTAYTYYDNGLTATVTQENLQVPSTSPTYVAPFVTESDTYDGAGNLLSSVTANGTDTTDYTYDAAGRTLTTTLDPSGVDQVTTQTYFADSTLATSTVTAQGTTQEDEYTYNAGDQELTDTLVADGINRETITTRDSRGLPLTVENPDGNTTTYCYDALGELTETQQPQVSVTSFDAATLAASSSEATPETTTGYNTFGETAETEDADGNVTTDYYDADGNLTETLGTYTPVETNTAVPVKDIRTYTADGELYQETDADGNVTTYGYDQFGDQTSVQDPVNGSAHPTQIGYNKAGQPTGQVSPGGTQSSAAYDALGRTYSTSVYEEATGTTNTTGYSYDTAGLLGQVTSPTNVKNSYTYDDLGEKTSDTDGAGNTTDYAYDGFGDVSKVTYANGVSTQNTYNALGQQTSTASTITGPLTCLQASCLTPVTLSTSTFSPGGNLTSTTTTISASQSATETFGYYPTGWLKDEIQPIDASHSITVSYAYDQAGNKTAYTDGDDNTTYWTYNGFGQPDTETAPATGTYTGPTSQNTYYVYDADGQLQTETQPGGVTENYTYDGNGDLATQTGSGASATTAARVFGYDGDGDMTSARTCTDTTCTTELTGETFGYDSEGDLLSAQGAAGESTFTYNADQQPLTETTPASTTPTTYTYDSAGRVHSVADPLTGGTDTYTYTNLNQVSSITYGSVLRKMAYDWAGDLTLDTVSNGSTQLGSISYGYNYAGEMTDKTDQTGTANTYSYDEAGRLTSWDTPTTDTAYTYDDDSNRQTITSSSAATGAVTNTVTNAYDTRDELTGSTSTPASGPAGTTTYTYAANGTMATSGANTVTFDAYGQESTDGTESYSYDALGRAVTQSSSTVGVGATTTTVDHSFVGGSNQLASDGNGDSYAYDPSGGIVAATVDGSGVDIWADQHTDVVGDFTPTDTSLLGTSQYDPLGNVISQTGNAASLSVGYQSEYTDPSTGQVNMDSRWYSPSTGQFSSADTAQNSATPNPANANPYGYANASPLNGTDPTGHGITDIICEITEECVPLPPPPTTCTPPGVSIPDIPSCGGDEVEEGGAYQPSNWQPTTSCDWASEETWYETCGGSFGPGPGSAPPGSYGDPRHPSEPSCDAICQATRWLHDLQHLSQQGRATIDPILKWFDPLTSLVGIDGPTDEPTNDSGGHCLAEDSTVGFQPPSGEVEAPPAPPTTEEPTDSGPDAEQPTDEPGNEPAESDGNCDPSGSPTQTSSVSPCTGTVTDGPITYNPMAPYYDPSTGAFMGCRATGASATVYPNQSYCRDCSTKPRCRTCEVSTDMDKRISGMVAQEGGTACGGLVDAGHLIPYAAGGSGQIESNLTPQCRRANQYSANWGPEFMVRSLADQNITVYMDVTAEYPSNFTGIPDYYFYRLTWTAADGSAEFDNCFIPNIQQNLKETCEGGSR